MKQLTKLEYQVMRLILSRQEKPFSCLEKQLEDCVVKSRKLTGCGFFTEFEIPAHIERLKDKTSFKLDDVQGNVKDLEHGVGFLLFIEEGAISMLEGYSYDEPWPHPDLEEEFQLSYEEKEH